MVRVDGSALNRQDRVIVRTGGVDDRGCHEGKPAVVELVERVPKGLRYGDDGVRVIYSDSPLVSHGRHLEGSRFGRGRGDVPVTHSSSPALGQHHKVDGRIRVDSHIVPVHLVQNGPAPHTKLSIGIVSNGLVDDASCFSARIGDREPAEHEHGSRLSA